ncbi:MAG: serine hydrolase [Bryobacteraceae bacterium]
MKINLLRSLVLAGLAAGLPQTRAVAQTGLPAGGFQDVDAVVQQLMATYQIPGVAVAIVKDGRLVLARGYGLADVGSAQPMQPGSLSRWNSISKTVTATGILKLVEQGRLDLEARAFDILSRIQPYNGVWGDPRIKSITVRQLLEHAGGWDSAISGDPIVSPLRDRIASTLGGPFLPTGESMIRYMIAQPLDFDPGTRFVYCNLGFQILALIIEEVSGQPYGGFIRDNVFNPIGATDMQVAGNLLEQRFPGEVHYYAWPGAVSIPSTLSPDHPTTPLPYATLDYAGILPAGGWLGSVLNLAKFVAAMDGQRQPAVLQPASFQKMLAPPDRILWFDEHTWYGLAMGVFESGGALYWGHPGASPGSRSDLTGLANGVSYAFLANSDSEDSSFYDQMTSQLSALCLSPHTWPEGDLFFEYYPPHPAATVSAASFQTGPAAPDSLLTIFGSELASRTESAAAVPLPLSLGSLSARVVDSSGVSHALPLLYASPPQVNFHLPAGVAAGPATLFIKRDPHAEVNAPLTIAAVSPGLFMANVDGLAAAVITRVRGDGSQATEIVSTSPIHLGNPGEEVYLSLYGTGIRGNSGLGAVTVHLGSNTAPALYAGSQVQFIGLDQVNVKLTTDLVGSGRVQVSLDADGLTSNSVSVVFE